MKNEKTFKNADFLKKICENAQEKSFETYVPKRWFYMGKYAQKVKKQG